MRNQSNGKSQVFHKRAEVGRGQYAFRDQSLAVYAIKTNCVSGSVTEDSNLTRWRVNLAHSAPKVRTDFMNWAQQSLNKNHEDHPPALPWRS